MSRKLASSAKRRQIIRQPLPVTDLRDIRELCTILCMNTPAHNNWVPGTQNFAVRLVLVRHEMGWNLKEAALACGVAAASWREWELSGRRPRDYEGVCKQIAARTQCDLIWLMAGNPNPDGGVSIQPVGWEAA